MSLPKAALFCWTGDPGEAAFFLREALGEWSGSGAALPLLVDCQPRKEAGLPLESRPARGLPLGGLRLLGEGSVPCLRASELPEAAREAQRKGRLDYLEERLLLLLPQPGKAAGLAEFCHEILFFAPAAKESVAALYNLALGLNALKGRSARVSVVVSGVDKIESAAEFLANALDEISKLSLVQAEIAFAGNFRVKEEKADILRRTGKGYAELFAKDSAYGQIKAIGRRWLPGASPAMGCASLPELAERIAALP